MLYRVSFLLEHPNPVKLREVIEYLSSSGLGKVAKIGGSIIIGGSINGKEFLIRVSVARTSSRRVEEIVAPAFRGLIVIVESDSPRVLVEVVNRIVGELKSRDPELLVSIFE